MNTRIIGAGGYLPEKILTNSDLEKLVETSDEWITTRTGIKERHIAAEGETTSDMAVIAAKKALENAKIDGKEIDCIIVATTTPDSTFPSTAVKVQSKLNIHQAAAFDVQAVCTGFIYALTIADALIKAGQANNVLVIGAEKMSAILDWHDRGTCILFGDGAGAVVLSKTDEKDVGLLEAELCAEGDYEDILFTDGGVATTGDAGKIRMKGKEVFKHAVAKMVESIQTVLEKRQLTTDAIDLLIPHQANSRILEKVGKKLKLSSEKLLSTVRLHANTSAASIPLAISKAVEEDRIKPGDIVVLTAVGGGLTWGSCLLKW